MLGVSIAAVVGLVAGYAFRGFISREKAKAAAALKSDASKAVSKL